MTGNKEGATCTSRIKFRMHDISSSLYGYLVIVLFVYGSAGMCVRTYELRRGISI